MCGMVFLCFYHGENKQQRDDGRHHVELVVEVGIEEETSVRCGAFSV